MRTPDRKLLWYIAFPKGPGAVLYRGYYYIPTAGLTIAHSENPALALGQLAFAFALIEAGICTSRNVLNDLRDWREDIERGGRWSRPVRHENRDLILMLVLAKLAVVQGAALAFGAKFFLIGTLLIVQQLAYDVVFKPRLPLFSIVIVAIGYGLRAASGFSATDSAVPLAVIVAVAFLGFLYAFYQALEWRIYESKFLEKRGLRAKPGMQFFARLDETRIPPFAALLFSLCAQGLAIPLIVGNSWLRVYAAAAVVTVYAFVAPERHITAIVKYLQCALAICLLSLIIPSEVLRALTLTMVLSLGLAYYCRVTVRSRALAILIQE